ncbi:hypothetical protein IW150_000750 [Coemansia sp. RSA 2607]|nr:hypothetical protein IW150_000750 [Coemansia sp. RSA 2607]
MGLIKKIKGSYMFTHMEVGKYTKRRLPASARDAPPSEMTVRAATTEFISEFDRAAAEAQREQQWQADEAEKRQRRQQAREARTNSSETLPVEPLTEQHLRAAPVLGRYKSSVELSLAQRERQGALPYTGQPSPASTAVSTPSASPFSATADTFEAEQPIPRPRPKGARSARSTVDMQSVYFAPGRNVTMTNQQKQRASVYPAENKPTFDKNSASSMDYYVFAPTRRDISSMPLDARRRARGVIAPEDKPAPELHAMETKAEAERAVSTNPFVERRKKAQVLVAEGWNSASPFTDPLVGSGRGGIDPNDPRKYLNTPMYANQAGSGGVDLLA